MCYLSDNIYDYYNVSQGKITIPNVDDGEECLLTDVSPFSYHPGSEETLFPPLSLSINIDPVEGSDHLNIYEPIPPSTAMSITSKDFIEYFIIRLEMK